MSATVLLKSPFSSPPVSMRTAAHGNSTSVAAPWPTSMKWARSVGVLLGGWPEVVGARRTNVSRTPRSERRPHMCHPPDTVSATPAVVNTPVAPRALPVPGGRTIGAWDLKVSILTVLSERDVKRIAHNRPVTVRSAQRLGAQLLGNFDRPIAQLSDAEWS